MKDSEIRQLVADTGRILLEKGLVARTWGNISVRKDESSFAISPSGLGYENMQGEDVPIYNYISDTWEGNRKPSSEKKIHTAAYQIYPEVNFVIHTHQDYATAVGLVGTEKLKMTPEEKLLLGDIQVAGYGLPGTDRLKNNVEAAYKKGSKVVLMVHHGAVILGQDRDDAMKKVEALEALCKRTVEEARKQSAEADMTAGDVSKELKAACQGLVVVRDENLLYFAQKGGFNAQLDDIAQMIGKKLRAVENDDAAILHALNKQDAVLVKGVGGVILTEDPDDAEALKLLLVKAAMAKRYTLLCNVKEELSGLDCALMHFIYKKKYAKQKEG